MSSASDDRTSVHIDSGLDDDRETHIGTRDVFIQKDVSQIDTTSLKITFSIESRLSKFADLVLSDALPDDVPIARVGFFPNTEADNWSVDDGDFVAELDRCISPNEEFTTGYYVEFTDPGLAEEYLLWTDPEKITYQEQLPADTALTDFRVVYRLDRECTIASITVHGEYIGSIEQISDGRLSIGLSDHLTVTSYDSGEAVEYEVGDDVLVKITNRSEDVLTAEIVSGPPDKIVDIFPEGDGELLVSSSGDSNQSETRNRSPYRDLSDFGEGRISSIEDSNSLLNPTEGGPDETENTLVNSDVPVVYGPSSYGTGSYVEEPSPVQSTGHNNYTREINRRVVAPLLAGSGTLLAIATVSAIVNGGLIVGLLTAPVPVVTAYVLWRGREL